MFGICKLIDFLVPDVPEALELKIKRERYLAKQALADTDAIMKVCVWIKSNVESFLLNVLVPVFVNISVDVIVCPWQLCMKWNKQKLLKKLWCDYVRYNIHVITSKWVKTFAEICLIKQVLSSWLFCNFLHEIILSVIQTNNIAWNLHLQTIFLRIYNLCFLIEYTAMIYVLDYTTRRGGTFSVVWRATCQCIKF